LDGFDTVADDDLRATASALRNQLSELAALLDAYADPSALHPK